MSFTYRSVRQAGYQEGLADAIAEVRRLQEKALYRVLDAHEERKIGEFHGWRKAGNALVRLRRFKRNT